jgi:hypothetical protein
MYVMRIIAAHITATVFFISPSTNNSRLVE